MGRSLRAASAWIRSAAKTTVRPEFEIESYLKRMRGASCALSTPTAICTCPVPATGSTSPNTAAGDVCKALRAIHARTRPGDRRHTDILFPLSQQEQIADGLRDGGAEVDFVALDSPQGHDAFLVDIELSGPRSPRSSRNCRKKKGVAGSTPSVLSAPDLAASAPALGTGDRTRTYTPSLARDFESPASTIPPHRHVGGAIIAQAGPSYAASSRPSGRAALRYQPSASGWNIEQQVSACL